LDTEPPGAGEADDPAAGEDPGTTADETWDDGIPPAGDTTAASAAGTADPATLTASAAAVTAVRAIRPSNDDSTMNTTI
jgi:hypothetical protein